MCTPHQNCINRFRALTQAKLDGEAQNGSQPYS